MRFLRFLLFCLLVSVSAQAETVVLVQDEVVNGEITKKTDSSITLIHKVFGELEIPQDQLFALVAGKPEIDTVVLVQGDTIYGKITEKTDSKIILAHNTLGKLEIPKDQIENIKFVHNVLGEITITLDRITSPGTMESYRQIPEETAAVVDLQDNQQEKTEEEKIWLEPEFESLNSLAGRLKKQKWSFALDFSINRTSGNTNEDTTRLGMHLKRNLTRERMALDGAYYHKKNTGKVTDNALTVGYLKDWLNPGSRWFFFGSGRYDYDEFESWEQRANIQVGPGYNLIGSDDMQLNFRLGAGGRKEWGSQNAKLKLEGLLGIDLGWELTDKQSIETGVWFFPVITDFDDYRTRSHLNWRYKLSKESDISLLFGVLHETQSIVDPGDDDTDTRIYTGIQVGF